MSRQAYFTVDFTINYTALLLFQSITLHTVIIINAIKQSSGIVMNQK